jgi:hypothetical protein
VGCPRPAYQRALEALTGRPFAELGFRQRNAIELPSPGELTPERLVFHVDEEGRVWATVDRRTFLVGSSAALPAQAGIGLADGLIPRQPSPGDMPLAAAGAPDPFGFAVFARQRWPDLRATRDRFGESSLDQDRCRSLARVGTAGLLRPRSRHIPTTGVDIACSYLGQSQVVPA